MDDADVYVSDSPIAPASSPQWDPTNPDSVLGVIRWIQEWGHKYWISQSLEVYVYTQNPQPKPPAYDRECEHKLELGERLRERKDGWLDVVRDW
ncbi:hypothetical protein [Mycobacteroides abscessus]